MKAGGAPTVLRIMSPTMCFPVSPGTRDLLQNTCLSLSGFWLLYWLGLAGPCWLCGGKSLPLGCHKKPAFRLPLVVVSVVTKVWSVKCVLWACQEQSPSCWHGLLRIFTLLWDFFPQLSHWCFSGVLVCFFTSIICLTCISLPCPLKPFDLWMHWL